MSAVFRFDGRVLPSTILAPSLAATPPSRRGPPIAAAINIPRPESFQSPALNLKGIASKKHNCAATFPSRNLQGWLLAPNCSRRRLQRARGVRTRKRLA